MKTERNDEQYRRECEARYVLKMPDDKRQRKLMKKKELELEV